MHILWSRRSHMFSAAVPILQVDCLALYVLSAGSQMLVYGPEFSRLSTMSLENIAMPKDHMSSNRRSTSHPRNMR